jgi:hypothetical protein
MGFGDLSEFRNVGVFDFMGCMAAWKIGEA